VKLALLVGAVEVRMAEIYLPSVLVGLENWPPTGSAGLSMRIRDMDRVMINRAAHALGMRQADFLRMVTVNAAREVVRQVEFSKAREEMAEPSL
jgi:hypothetical protein